MRENIRHLADRFGPRHTTKGRRARCVRCREDMKDGQPAIIEYQLNSGNEWRPNTNYWHPTCYFPWTVGEQRDIYNLDIHLLALRMEGHAPNEVQLLLSVVIGDA